MSTLDILPRRCGRRRVAPRGAILPPAACERREVYLIGGRKSLSEIVESHLLDACGRHQPVASRAPRASRSRPRSPRMHPRRS